MAAQRVVGAFFLRVLAWLPLAFFAWYYTAPVLTLPISLALDAVLPALFPALLAGVEHHGYTVDVVTRLAPEQVGAVGGASASGVVLFELNPLIYQYSIPLFFGLTLASPGSERRRLVNLGIGLLLLLLVAGLGVALEILKILAFESGPEVVARLPDGVVLRNLLALSYQVGYLILPAISPVILWIALYRGFVLSLAPGLLRVAGS